MTKKDFIGLADAIKAHDRRHETPFSAMQLVTLADFCARTNSRFKKERWLNYIAGHCTKNGKLTLNENKK